MTAEVQSINHFSQQRQQTGKWRNVKCSARNEYSWYSDWILQYLKNSTLRHNKKFVLLEQVTNIYFLAGHNKAS